MEAHGMTPSKLRIIPNGVSPDVFDEPSRPSPLDLSAPTSGGPFTVGFAGTLGIANNLETLIEAAQLLADEPIRFVIVGQGSQGDRLRALARNNPRVEFVGAVPKSDIPATLRLFDVCYVGYRRSPLYRFGISPNKVFEYMAASRPIVLAAEAFNDPVRDAGCGLTVPPDDPASLADAIMSLLKMSARDREQLGTNGRAFVEREHSYTSLAASYVAVLRPTDQ
jgi:glycosyltransferase involved in cell wall biosynthesis